MLLYGINALGKQGQHEPIYSRILCCVEMDMNNPIFKLVSFFVAVLHINQNAFAELYVVNEMTKAEAVYENFSKKKISLTPSAQVESQLSTTKQPQPIAAITPVLNQPPIIKPLPRWTLTAGHAIGQELKRWGTKSGWNVIWNLPRDLIVPSNTEFIGEFPTVAANVIKTLAANGALINAKFYEGNKTMVINGPGVVPQN